jgi:GNAT superfamily N-acetyltransferase
MKGYAMSTDPYRLRTARPDERDRIQEIEDLAGTRFAGLGLIDESLDAGFPTAELDRLIRAGQVWVACDAADRAVGMVIASVRDDAVYVEEMDVLAEHGRRGLGGRLLGAVCTWAREQGYSAVTLSTFRDVPWNGPFYRTQGFTDLPPAAWTPGMRAIRENEARHGLRTDMRVFMRRDLGVSTSVA